MARRTSSAGQLREQDLCRWRLVADFKQRLAKAARGKALHPSWRDPERLLKYPDYLGLFLFGLLNPVVRTMRGLCRASRLRRVQEEVCCRPVSLGSFSEAQALLEPELLAEVFEQLSRELSVPAEGQRPAGRNWLIQDSSLFEALPRMHWALWRRQGKAQSQVRLHLSLDLAQDAPVRAHITPGKGCERAAWRRQWRRGDGFVADRYYGEDYRFFEQLEASGVAFVVRLRDQAVVNVETELPLSPEDRQAKVIRAVRAHLGCKRRYRSIGLWVIWVQTDKEILPLVTNLSPQELSAGQVALLYKHRWQVELFFRWIKCILGARHWLAESPPGAALQLYLALIAALLLQLYTGQRPNRRMIELIQFYLLGVASLDELEREFQAERQKSAGSKKS